jgi:hypothetical protein
MKEHLTPTQSYFPEWEWSTHTAKIIQPHSIVVHKTSPVIAKQIISPFPPNKLPRHISNNIQQIIKKVHLCINNIQVATDYLSTIRHANSTNHLNTYFIDKYNWTSTTINLINWNSHAKALSTMSGRRLKTTTQLIHQWLPVFASSAQNKTSTARLCPYCTTCDETHTHYLSCLQTNSVNARHLAVQQIRKKLQKYNIKIHNQLIKLITTALTDWLFTPHPIRPTFLSEEFHPIFYYQSLIGWDQILYGQFATEWTTITQDTYKTNQWLPYTIQLIWTEFYTVWKHRCDQIHGKSNNKVALKLLTLQPQVEQLYKSQNKTDSEDSYLFATSLTDMLQKPTATIQKWIFTTTVRLRQIRIRQKQRLNKTKVHPFFSMTKFTFKQNKFTKLGKKHTKTKVNINPISLYFPLLLGRKAYSNKLPKDDLHPP